MEDLLSNPWAVTILGGAAGTVLAGLISHLFSKNFKQFAARFSKVPYETWLVSFVVSLAVIGAGIGLNLIEVVDKKVASGGTTPNEVSPVEAEADIEPSHKVGEGSEGTESISSKPLQETNPNKVDKAPTNAQEDTNSDLSQKASASVENLATILREESTYRNTKYNYDIAYPIQVLKPLGEAENGEGQSFQGDGAFLRVWATQNSTQFGKSLETIFNEQVNNPNRTITYQVIRDDWFVVSGYEGSQIFYQKTFVRNEIEYSFVLTYSQEVSGIFDTVVEILINSFTPGNSPLNSNDTSTPLASLVDTQTDLLEFLGGQLPRSWGGSFNQTAFETYKTDALPMHLTIKSIEQNNFTGEINWRTPQLAFETTQVIGRVIDELPDLCNYEDLLDESKKRVFIAFEEKSVNSNIVETRGEYRAQIDDNGYICGKWIFLGGREAIIPGRFMLSPSGQDRLTPAESLITYYENLTNSRFDAAWSMLAESFQQRKHNGDYAQFIANIQAEKYCDLRVLHVTPFPLESTSSVARVSASLISSKNYGNGCETSVLPLVYIMLYDQALGYWRIDKVLESEESANGLFLEASLQYLTEEDLRDKTSEELSIMRNEIFARYGYVFGDPDLYNYFNQQPWYKPVNDNSTIELTPVEKANVDLIRSYEAKE